MISDQLTQSLQSRPQDWLTAGERVDAAGLEAELRAKVEGEVRFDAGSRAMYATDASNYRQVPIGVVIPKSKEDVVQTVAACRRFGAPLLSRGGGTSLAGECCNVAVVIDWSKYMHGVLEVNLAERWARVLPGTICDELRNTAMQRSKRKLLIWGPDPATHDRCCFGGMIGNNSCGAHAQMSGKTDDNIEEMEMLLYDGPRMTSAGCTIRRWERRSARAAAKAKSIATCARCAITTPSSFAKNYPPIPRRVSGYNLDQLIPDDDGRFNIARALVGSEGTLVDGARGQVPVDRRSAERVILMLGYPDVYEAADHVVELNQFNPTALEGMDDRLHYNMQKKGGPIGELLHLLPEGKGWLMAEFGADKHDEALDTAHRAMDMLQERAGCAAHAAVHGQARDGRAVGDARVGAGRHSFCSR